MVFIKRVIQILLSPFRTIVQKYKYRKKIKELQKRDPFIYKQDVLHSRMIVWGITGNNHDASLAVMEYHVKGLTDRWGLYIHWAGKSSDFSGIPGDPNLCPCLLYTSPSPRDTEVSRMPSSA